MSQEDYVRKLMRDATGMVAPGKSPELDAMAAVKEIIASYEHTVARDYNEISRLIKIQSIEAIKGILRAHRVKGLSGALDLHLKISDRQSMRILITNEDLGVT